MRQHTLVLLKNMGHSLFSAFAPPGGKKDLADSVIPSSALNQVFHYILQLLRFGNLRNLFLTGRLRTVYHKARLAFYAAPNPRQSDTERMRKPT